MKDLIKRFERMFNEIVKMEIEDQGYDFSLKIYQVYRLSKNGNDTLEMSYIHKEDAIKYINEMKEDKNNYYWSTRLVWFNK